MQKDTKLQGYALNLILAYLLVACGVTLMVCPQLLGG